MNRIFSSQLPPSAGTKSSECFKLITTLYNETNKERAQEYIECLERNLSHAAIDEIHVLYDTIKDTPTDNVILEFLKSQNITIKYIKGRPGFAQLFDYANHHFPNQKIIVTNADIFFNETLFRLTDFNFTHRFLALTRWDLHRDGTLHLLMNRFGKPNMYSQDSWIFKAPLLKIECDTIHMGILGCDSQLAHQAFMSGVEVYNPCHSIQCCHLHLTGVRNDERNDRNPHVAYKEVPWNFLEDIH